MKIVGSGLHRLGLVYNTVAGPWPCEKCGQLTQFAEMKGDRNIITCHNDRCRYRRIVHTQKRRILENDGTLWEYDPQTGRKTRITMQ